MKEKILIVEDQFVEADYLQLMLTQAGYEVTGIARSVAQAKDLIAINKPGLILLDIFLKGKQTGIDLAKDLSELNIPFVYLSANSNEEILNAAKATQPYGFLVKPFREQDLLVTLEIAKYRYEHSIETRYHKEAELQKELKKIITESLSWEEKLLKIAKSLQPFIPFDFLAAGIDNLGQSFFQGMCFLRIGFDEYQSIGIRELSMITGKTIGELGALQTDNPKDAEATIYDEIAFQNLCKFPSLQKLFADKFNLRSHLEMPLEILNNKPFSFCLYSRRPDAYNGDHLDLFGRIQYPLVQIIEKMWKQENGDSKNQPVKTGDHNHTGIDIPAEFKGIVGKSYLLLNVFDQITQVAGSDTSVLILGESGTGKERIADAIHHLSNRKNKPFVKVNCAALPATLIESELFGHEKGAFTGAVEKRVGKFEKAEGGTIFLDEVGEMPIELQVKLLRVLQEKEIERVGGTDTKKINVRIIAATNRNLEKEVAEGRFRLDLYYRLNVFPISLPALRDRKEDIPALAYHFMNHYNSKAGKKLSGFADKVLNSMMSYDWPGNVRELEHLIERSVLLARGNIISEVLLPINLKNEDKGNEMVRMKSIAENEKDHILAALKKSNGRIWGQGGAAELLNIAPTTLASRMKKLGIKKEYIQ